MRSPSRVLASIVVAGALPALVAGCGGKGNQSAFCKTIQAHHSVFDVKDPHDDDAQAAFARMAAEAPPEVRADFVQIAADTKQLWAGDPKFWLDKDRTDRYTATVLRLDDYLRDECNADIPNREKRPTRLGPEQ